MKGQSDAGTIRDFLWGRPSGQNGADFLARLNDDASLRREFEKELAFEALFYSMSWNIQKIEGLAAMADWASLAAPLSIIEKEQCPDQPTALEWDRMVNNAFESAFPSPMEKNNRSRIVPFPKLFRYLAAACIVGVIAGMTLLPPHKVSEKVPGNVARDTPALSKKSTVAAKRENPPATAIVFDSIVIYGPRSITGKPILTETHDGIVRIGDRTAILLDKNSSVAVTSRSDSAVAVDLNSGGALFTVEKHRFNRFSVSTPACKIAVTGTVFRLAIENDMTIVSVLEGSVRAGIRHDSVMVSIDAGTSARIRPDTIMLENGDTAATLLYRSNILSDFLHENGVFENGMFVRSGIVGKNGTIARHDHTIEQSIDKEQQRAVDK